METYEMRMCIMMNEMYILDYTYEYQNRQRSTLTRRFKECLRYPSFDATYDLVEHVAAKTVVSATSQRYMESRLVYIRRQGTKRHMWMNNILKSN